LVDVRAFLTSLREVELKGECPESRNTKNRLPELGTEWRIYEVEDITRLLSGVEGRDHWQYNRARRWEERGRG
jgi:hypothetical protein